jgi:hypothetical protein
MPDHRTPSFLAALGGAFLALGLGSWLLSGESWFFWASMLLAWALLAEAYYWRGAMTLAAMYYQRTAEHIERVAYNPTGALLRCCFLFASGLLYVVLGGGGLDVLPDGGWLGVAIFGPVACYVVLAALAYRRDVLAAAKQNKWRRRAPRER